MRQHLAQIGDVCGRLLGRQIGARNPFRFLKAPAQPDHQRQVLPHTCIGIHLARLEVRVFLDELLAAVPDWRLDDGVSFETIRLASDEVPARFDALPLEVG